MRKGSASAEAAGPSDLLSAALRNAQASWTATREAEAPSMREILREASAKPKGLGGRPATGAKAKSAEAKAAGAKLGASGAKAEAETKCSWGFDALPSEKPKNDSMYSIQQQEQQEQEKQRQLDEIREIEAMFEALEVAEREDALEQEGARREPTVEGINDPKAPKRAREKAAPAEAAGRTSGREAGARNGWKKGWAARSGWASGWSAGDWSGQGWSGWQEGDRRWVPRGAAETRQETDF